MRPRFYQLLPGICFLGILCLLIFAVGIADGETIIVAKDGGDYYSIQAAVENATDGDTIRVYEGTYSENVELGKAVNLIGNGSEMTILVGNGSGIGIDMDGISGASISNMRVEEYDIGIKLYESTENDISGIEVRSNVEYGLYIRQWSNRNSLVGNIAHSNFQGIYLYNSNENSLSNNIVYGNTVSGITLWGGDNTATDNTVFDNNQGIHINLGSRNIVTHNNVTNNTQVGIVSSYSGTENVISDNVLSENGEGIRFSSGTRENTIKGNAITLNDVGIYLLGMDETRIFNNSIEGNRIGIYLKDSSENNSAWNNNILGNSEYGVETSENSLVEASDNWWGDKSGAYHPTNNSEGSGDNVTDRVDFTPWMENRIFWPPMAHLDLITPNPVFLGETVYFSGHTTGEGKITRHVWSSSIAGELYNGSEEDHSTDSLPIGEHTISYKVQNETGSWSETATEILVDTERPVAIIESISPNPALEGEWVMLKANGSIAVGGIDRYEWRSSIDGIVMISLGPNFQSMDLSLGDHTIYLRVQDEFGIWSFDVSTTLTIHIAPTAIIDSISPNPGIKPGDVVFRGTGVDDGPIARYVWRSDLDGEMYNGSEETITISNLTYGKHVITLLVVDEQGEWSVAVNDTLQINEKPLAIIDTIDPNPALDTDMITFTRYFVDCCVRGNITRYLWTSDLDGELYDGPNGSFSRSGLSIGNHTITLRVQDEFDFWSNEAIRKLVILSRPIIESHRHNFGTSHPLSRESGAVTYTFEIIATDADGWIDRYSIVSSMDGELYNATNNSFTMTGLSVGNHTIFIKVVDNDGIWSVENTFTITEPPRNIKPSITIISPQNNGTVEETESIIITADDEDGTFTNIHFSIDEGNWTNRPGPNVNLSVATTGLTEGPHTLSVRSWDGIQYSPITTIMFTVVHTETPDEDDEGNALMVGGVIILIITGIIAAVVLWPEHGSKKED